MRLFKRKSGSIVLAIICQHGCQDQKRRGERGFILIRVLNRSIEMRKTHHRSQTGFVIGQLIETVAELLTQKIKRGEKAIVKILLAQFFPQVFNWVDFWAISDWSTCITMK